MLKLIYTLQIDTGKTRRSRRFGRDDRRLILRVTGTPEALREFLTQMQRIPSDVACYVSFCRGEHPSGVYINSALAFPANAQFFESVKTMLAQLQGA